MDRLLLCVDLQEWLWPLVDSDENYMEEIEHDGDDDSFNSEVHVDWGWEEDASPDVLVDFKMAKKPKGGSVMSKSMSMSKSTSTKSIPGRRNRNRDRAAWRRKYAVRASKTDSSQSGADPTDAGSYVLSTAASQQLKSVESSALASPTPSARTVSEDQTEDRDKATKLGGSPRLQQTKSAEASKSSTRRSKRSKGNKPIMNTFSRSTLEEAEAYIDGLAAKDPVPNMIQIEPSFSFVSGLGDAYTKPVQEALLEFRSIDEMSDPARYTDENSRPSYGGIYTRPSSPTFSFAE